MSVAFSHDGRRLASCSHDRTVRIWDAETGALQRTLDGHTDSVRSVAFYHDGRRLASCSHDRTVRIWDVETGALQRTLDGHTDLVWQTWLNVPYRTVSKTRAILHYCRSCTSEIKIFP